MKICTTKRLIHKQTLLSSVVRIKISLLFVYICIRTIEQNTASEVINLA